MRLNFDLLRDILIAVSSELVPDDTGSVSPIFPRDLARSSLSQYPENETLYWIRKLMDEQILIKEKNISTKTFTKSKICPWSDINLLIHFKSQIYGKSEAKTFRASLFININCFDNCYISNRRFIKFLHPF